MIVLVKVLAKHVVHAASMALSAAILLATSATAPDKVVRETVLTYRRLSWQALATVWVVNDFLCVLLPLQPWQLAALCRLVIRIRRLFVEEEAVNIRRVLGFLRRRVTCFISFELSSRHLSMRLLVHLLRYDDALELARVERVLLDAT